MTIVAPVELAARPQWVAWKLELRDNRNTKVPYNARTGARASSTDPHTWATFEEACAFCQAENANGVGYVLSPEDPYVGIDLDHCRDPHSGRIEQWAKDVVKRLNSYTEISPSGTGLRIFIRGILPPHGRRKGPIEIYSQARFLTITGDHVLFAPDTIQDRPVELLRWHAEIFGPAPEPRQNGHVQRSPVQLADADLLLKARAATNGGAFWALWNGDYSSYGSQSEADLALLNHLAFWTGPDPSRLDNLFRASGLMREKWDRPDYRDRSIDKALEGKTEFYSGESTSQRLTGSAPEQPVTVVPDTWARPISALLEQGETDPDWLVHSLFSVGSSGFIAAEPKVGKSFISLELAHCMAAGEPFLDKFEVKQPRRVLFIEEEDPERRMVRRFKQLLRGTPGRVPPRDDMFRYVVRSGFRLDDAAWLGKLKEELTSFRPEVVFLDVFNKLHLKDENNQPDMSAILHTLASLTREFGCAFIIIHHYRKSGIGQSQRGNQMLRGSSALAGFAECSLFLRKGTGKIVICEAESKDVAELEPFNIRIVDVENNGTRVELTDDPMDDVSASARTLLEWLSKEGSSRTLYEMRLGTQLSTASVERAKKHLAESGLLVPDGKSGRAVRWKVTDGNV